MKQSFKLVSSVLGLESAQFSSIRNGIGKNCGIGTSLTNLHIISNQKMENGNEQREERNWNLREVKRAV